MGKLKAIIDKIMPPPKKSADGRDLWPSRASFLLASLSGVIGMGKFLRYPFESPLPWAGDTENYFMYEDTGAVDQDTSGTWVDYPGVSLDGRLVGWNAFLWFLVWLCFFRGTGWTGRTVYFTMGLPVIVIIILIGRGASLPNAGDGIRMYFATWRSEALAETGIWQDAVGQVFYSTGVGFGYYTAYVSYSHEHANAAQDSVNLVFTNAILEATLAFAAFGIVGFMGLTPDPENPMGSYSLGCMTYPEAFVQMPASNSWFVLFFLTLGVVGVNSTFVMLDAVMTLIMDSSTARTRRWSRPLVATVLVILVFLLSLPNCTQFGYQYLEGIDAWINNVGLVFVVWAECVGATTIYRHEDVVDQVELVAFIIYNSGFFSAQLLSLIISHTVSVAVGAGVGFGIFAVTLVAGVLVAKTPTVNVTARLFGNNTHTSKLYYLAFYSGNQLRHDLNAVIAIGKNWSLPFFWVLLLRYITGPILSIILSLAYPSFEDVNNDPLHIMGFIVAHFLLLDVFIVPERRDDWKQPTAPGILRDTAEAQVAYQLESCSSSDITDGKKEELVDGEMADGHVKPNSNSFLTGDPRGDDIGRL